MNLRFRVAAFAGSALLFAGAAAAQDALAQDKRAQNEQQSSQSKANDSKANDRSQNASNRQARANEAQPFVMLLVPIAMEKQTESLANGCWVKLYGGRDYQGDSFTTVGPADMPDMVGPFGIDWDDKVSSIKTGPKATVTIYDNENYRDKTAKLQPGQQVPHLSEKLGFFEEVESMKISCAAKSG